MTRFHTTSAAVILAVAALGLGACGDDNKSSTSGDSATNDAIATNSTDTTNGTTGTGTGTGKTGTTDDKGKTSTTEKGDDKGGSRGGGGGGGDDSSGSGSGNSGSGNGGNSTGQKELTSKNVKSTAKTVCTSFLPTALQRDLKNGKKSAEEIAKDYSRAFPTSQRKAAYDGCLAGLKTKD